MLDKNNTYEEIRNHNIKWYGESINQPGGAAWTKLIFERLYSDKTHFIYELLQNAEDACERKRSATGKVDFKLNFKLVKNELEVRHNGIEFNEKDVANICDIGRDVEDKEKNNMSQIGKFGIGFKSVYAYTKTPIIYSGDYAFKIEKYVLPYPVDRREDLDNEETLFIIPFNRSKEVLSQTASKKEVEERLKSLGIKVLLFLKNLKEIRWETNEKFEKYTRSSDSKDGYRWVTLYQNDKAVEKWLVFEKPIPNDGKGRVIEVAYYIGEDKENKRKRNDTKLFVYFPTQKETGFNFLIQGPYNTTASRENIENDEWNKDLIRETGSLIAESITKIKTINLLNVSFLETLLPNIEFDDKNNLFKPIYDKVTEKLKSDEALLPADDGSYVSANKALLVRSANLKMLLSTIEQLSLLFKRTKWLTGEITQDKSPSLREYLMNVLEIPEIDPETFAKSVNEDFLKTQSDEWIIKFYKFLRDQEALWRPKTLQQPEGVLRTKPIIRLEDGTHITPFDKDGKANAYIPSSTDKNTNRLFSTVKSTIASDVDANVFLKRLGLSEPDQIAGVIEYILPKYSPDKDISKISLEDNVKDVIRISKVLKLLDGTKKNDLLNKIKQTKILYCINCKSKKTDNEINKRYCSPNEVSIYLGKTYTHDSSIETFFEGNENVWLLDDRYNNKDISIDTLKSLGCKNKNQYYNYINSQEGQDKLDYILKKLCDCSCIYRKDYRAHYERGLDWFDPEFEIEGLEWALNNITIEKSIIIWNIITSGNDLINILIKLKDAGLDSDSIYELIKELLIEELGVRGAYKNYKLIKGTVETSTNKDYRNSQKEQRLSKMGKLLTEKPWLYSGPENDSAPHKPSDIMVKELSSRYNIGSIDPKIITEIERALDFKVPIVDERSNKWREQLPEKDRKLIDLLDKIPNDKKEEYYSSIESLIVKKNEEERREDTNPTDAAKVGIGRIMSKEVTPPYIDPLDDDDVHNNSLTPEDERDIEEGYGKNVLKFMKENRIVKKIKLTTEGKTIDGIDMKQFLFAQYKGQCQICNTRLYLGSEEKGTNGFHFDTYHILKRKNKYSYADMEWNVLSLCPNHFALLEHGKIDLKGIFYLAKNVLNQEISAELVEERKGNYYIAKIKIMIESEFKDTELYYSQEHMSKLVGSWKLWLEALEVIGD